MSTLPAEAYFQVIWPKIILSYYVIVAANNVDTRSSEVNNVEAWAEANNLTLNRNKSVEIVFTTKRKRQLTPPPLLSGITRITTMKMLRVTISG